MVSLTLYLPLWDLKPSILAILILSNTIKQMFFPIHPSFLAVLAGGLVCYYKPVHQSTRIRKIMHDLVLVNRCW